MRIQNRQCSEAAQLPLRIASMFAASIAFPFAVSGCADNSLVTSAQPATIWQAIDHFAGHLPMTRADVEATLSVELTEVESGSRGTFRFFRGGGAKLQDGLKVSKIDLRMGVSADHPGGILILEVTGRCIPVDEVRQKYASLAITHAPSGHSRDQSYYYSRVEPWGRLSFRVEEGSPPCLSEVILDSTN